LSLPALTKNAIFEWTKECKEAFQEFKRLLASPPTFSKSTPDEIFYLYLLVANETISAVLIREDNEGQKPIYFVSKALQGAELRYQKVEKIVFALVISSQ